MSPRKPSSHRRSSNSAFIKRQYQQLRKKRTVRQSRNSNAADAVMINGAVINGNDYKNMICAFIDEQKRTLKRAAFLNLPLVLALRF
jgi:hypothetical protein